MLPLSVHEDCLQAKAHFFDTVIFYVCLQNFELFSCRWWLICLPYCLRVKNERLTLRVSFKNYYQIFWLFCLEDLYNLLNVELMNEAIKYTIDWLQVCGLRIIRLCSIFLLGSKWEFYFCLRLDFDFLCFLLAYEYFPV